MTDQAREAFGNFMNTIASEEVQVVWDGCWDQGMQNEEPVPRGTSHKAIEDVFEHAFDAGIQSVACCIICICSLDDVVRKREVIKCWNIYSKYHGKIVKPTFCCSHFSPRFREE